jgi:DNA modification methylase
MSVRILQGDCRDVLRTLADGSVHCCVTSPPYFGLRDYGNAAQIGLEPTPAEFVAQLVEVFREVRRVLRDDGTLWLNLGDSYASKAGGYSDTGSRGTTSCPSIGAGTMASVVKGHLRTPPEGLKSKDLIGIPWRVAFALQADGWYLRQDIIWHKPNPMPESVRDRCTKAHEYVFLLSKSERYFYDLEAMQEPAVAEHLAGNKSHKSQTAYQAGDERLRTKAGLTAYCERQRSKRDSFKRDDSKRAEVIPGQTVGTHRADREESAYDTATRNKRSVWTIATKPFSEAHFATMAPELAETCIKAGCPEGGTVLDPFGGAGTTGLVADQLQRHAVLCELNADYIAIARRRIAGDAPLFADVEVA